MARGILSSLLNLFRPAPRPSTTAAPTAPAVVAPGRSGSTATREIDPPSRSALRITYKPVHDADPDAGEIVWTWVPYAERDGRGKDRPVLVIGRCDADTVYAVKLTSKAHDGQRDFLPIGSGAWDSQGRPSWVDIDQFYLVHRAGMRREAAALDLERFVRVADALHRRYGWAVGDPR
ncbi:type II toxin-antitoxin system PemK/MazF family toxin [Microbacterium jejuense]|uniref:type II toxin-antitoxin system PemK/MazF family toxin n=1 Tax=Microbacterium jejuense TaxID=1263637 RepID=UPI0031E8C5D2